MAVLLCTNPAARASDTITQAALFRSAETASRAFSETHSLFAKTGPLACPAPPAGSRCRGWQEFLSQNAEVIPGDFIAGLADRLANGSSVIALGEDHSDWPTKRQYPALFRALRQAQPEINCIHIEFGSNFQPDIDAFMRSEITRTELEARMRQQIAALHFNERKTLNDVSPWLDLIESVKNRGVRVNFFDQTLSERSAAGNYWRSIAHTHRRNVRMADQVAADHASGRCQASVTINGSVHLMQRIEPDAADRHQPGGRSYRSSSSPPTLNTIQDLLMARGLSVSSAVLASAESCYTSPVWWNADCRRETYRWVESHSNFVLRGAPSSFRMIEQCDSNCLRYVNPIRTHVVDHWVRMPSIRADGSACRRGPND